MQRIRQAEKENMYDEFKDRAGEVVTGSVKRFDRSDVVVDLGKFEALMPNRERVQTEDYNIGDRVRAQNPDLAAARRLAYRIAARGTIDATLWDIVGVAPKSRAAAHLRAEANAEQARNAAYVEARLAA